MKTYAFILSAALTFPSFSHACIGSGEEVLRQNLRFYPIVGDSTSHWPVQQTMVVGSIASFLVPVDAKIEFSAVPRGLMAPLTVLGGASHQQIRASRNIVPAWVDIEYNPKKYKWTHVYAASYGMAEVRMKAPGGWGRNIKFSMVYPSKTDMSQRKPLELTLVQGDMQMVETDAYDNIEVTVAGKVEDGWTASPASDTGFELVRIQQVEKIDGEPEVRLFFASTRGPKSSTMILRRARGDAADSLEFRIKAVSTPSC